MGTYDTAGGSPRHDPAFDRGDDIHPLEDEVLGAIETAQTIQWQLDAELALLADAMNKALRALVKPGMVIDLRARRDIAECLWSVKTISGNDRGTRIFRIESEPTVEPNVTHPNLSRWRCVAVPVSEKTGKDMSASAGNKGRLQSTVRLAGYFGAVDRHTNESSTDLALRTVRAAAESLARNPEA